MYSSHAHHAALQNWPQRRNVSQMFCEFASRVFEMHLRHLTALTVHLLCVQGVGGESCACVSDCGVCVCVCAFHCCMLIFGGVVSCAIAIHSRGSRQTSSQFDQPNPPPFYPLPWVLFRTAPSFHTALLPFTASLCCLCSRHSRSCSVVNKFAFLSILMATEHTHTHMHTQPHTRTHMHTHSLAHTGTKADSLLNECVESMQSLFMQLAQILRTHKRS